MKATTLANWESKFRSLITKLPPRIAIKIYSEGRLYFLARLKEEVPDRVYTPVPSLTRELWGIKFRTPIMNAAGMFKNGECYDMVIKQGAGAYLGGTGTWNPRVGNKKDGVYLPFVPYTKSHSASNWLGLPNDGDKVNSQRAKQLQHKRLINTPIGWSVASSPDYQGEEGLKYLTNGLWLYDQAGVNFLEINESCPNIIHKEQHDIVNRLRYIKELFLDQRIRRLPVIVKFSNDVKPEQLPFLLDTLLELGYDGINLGNTSVDLTIKRLAIDPSERKLFDFYARTFGGCISGRPLRESSLELASRAVEYVKAGPPSQEFHVIRTGGISDWKDIHDSEKAGISLNQWFTGYFEAFAKHGHGLYEDLFEF